MPLTPPSAGQPVSATLISELIREIHAQRILPGKNTSVSRTVNGTVVACAVSARQTSKPSDTSCFKISSMKIERDDEGTVTKARVTFANRYVMQGGTLAEVERYEEPTQEDVEGTEEGGEGTEEGGEEEPTEEDPGLDILERTIAAVVYEEDGAGSLQWFIKAFEDISELKNEQRDASKYVFPLYRFDEETYEVVTDFRSAPNIQVFDDAYANLDEQSEDEQ